MTYTIPVTVVVPVKDEERNIAHCLSRLGRFAHVWVIDSGSEDRTAKIARTHGAELIQFRWDGTYPKKRNWVLLNQPIPTEWVLFLDADELVDETFCAELVNAIGCAEKVGYWLQFTNYFLGTPLLHGDPQRKLALFRVGAGLYERIDEDSWSALDMEVHEHPVLNGHVGEISARIYHDDDRGILRFIDRHRDYAQWEARRTQSLRASGKKAWAALTPRQQAKYNNIDKWWFAGAYFFATYVYRCGFLDGKAGFVYAFYKLWYFITVRLLIKEGK